MRMKRIVFMGTPDFAVPILEGLIEEYEVVGVVSQPDKKVGRKQILTPTPVKKVALEHQILVLQPHNIRQEYQEILNLKPDIIITCAYGQIVPKELLQNPVLGCINVHASLLPKLRGGAPIHKAIINGDSKTGITIMYMEEKLDCGDIIASKETQISMEDNLERLHNRLSIIGKELLLDTLPSIFNQTNQRIKQDEKVATYAFNITHEDEHIDFSKTKLEIFNQVRGLNPIPGAYCLFNQEVLKIYNTDLSSEKKELEKSIGEITHIYKHGIGVKVGDGELIITEVKPFGKRRMLMKDYLNGVKKEELLGKILI
ncbi:MAG: methionyl-tRNA formyltransferase [Bacilli bacterium]|nr:methionyl-tRNA formyltransferase [Bacilli bacterium]